MKKNNWKKILSPEEHHVLIEKGTEKPFSGKFLYNKEDGIYSCKVCGNVLFNSKTKFDSGTGWPSFYDLAENDAVHLSDDIAYGMKRIEVSCVNCGSHLGHVFEDGPSPTGKRYCINSVALNFKKNNLQ